MYTVMLVDDEKFVLDGLKKKINWPELNLKIIGEANDGIEAFPLIQKLQPDIIVTDIKMPIMGGLELIEQVRKFEIQSEVILLTGHEEFEFAKKAITFNVIDYLLKPCGKQQIQAALTKATIKLKEKDLQKKKNISLLPQHTTTCVKQNFVLSLVQNNFENQTLSYNMLIKSFPTLQQGKFIVCSLELSNEEKGKLSNHDLNIFALINIINETLNKYPDSICVKLTSRKALILLTFSKDLANEVILQKTIWIIHLITDNIFTYLGLRFSLGMSTCGINYTTINDLYLQAEYALNNRFIFGTHKIIKYTDCIYCLSYNPALLNTKVLDIMAIIKSKDKLAILNSIKDFYSSVHFLKLCHFDDLCISTTKFIIELSKLLPSTVSDKLVTQYIIDIRKALLNLPDLDALICYMHSITETVFNAFEQTSNYNKITLYVMNHVEQNYKSSISLKEIASQLAITPNYISLIFKNDTGITFKNYLTQIRISKAKSLLFSKDLKINEISYLVGYDNFEYFSKVFKEYAGHTPSEYRNLLF